MSVQNDCSLDAAVFHHAPIFGVCKIDCLASFAVFGLDVKIAPGDAVYIIEINGLNSGMAGFEKANVSYARFLRIIGKQHTTFSGRSDAAMPNSCQSALEDHLKELGEPPLAYIAAQLRKRNVDPSKIRAYDGVPDNGEVHQLWHAYDRFVDVLVHAQRISEDKLAADALFEECREIKTKTCPVSCENFVRLVVEENPSYVVVKPKNSCAGDRVSILSVEELLDSLEQIDLSFVMERFIYSKPIKSTKDGLAHDGCMRYVVCVEEACDGAIRVHHFGGYWRLCPKPLSALGYLDAMRANLAQGAIPEQASDEDLVLASKTVDKYLPRVYRKLIEKVQRI